MNQNKKFYWLKLRDDFFNTTEIKIMKSLPNGKDYIILLLQLRLLSINNWIVNTFLDNFYKATSLYSIGVK